MVHRLEKRIFLAIGKRLMRIGVIIMSIVLFIVGITVTSHSALAQTSDFVLTSNDDERNSAEKEDTTLKTRYPLRKAQVEDYDQLYVRPAIDTKEENEFKTEIEYDPESGLYIVHRRIGNMDIATPFALNENEYSDYTVRQSMDSYWAEKNQGGTGGKRKFDLSNIEIGLGVTGDKIFGPGGIKLKMQGTVDLKMGLSITRRENPSISEKNRKITNFNFDPTIQISANGSVGDKIKFGINYNTAATFDTDQQLIKLSYEGKEDDIIKKVEVGDVSLPLTSSLIPGSTSLFGIRTDLQYGKFKVSAIVSQQETETKTISTKNGAQTTEFEVNVLDYDENRHFFLSQFFYDNYDKWMEDAPNITSGIVINKCEVWVTNRSTSTNTSTRNIIGFTDLAEETNKSGNPWNGANGLYKDINSDVELRDYSIAANALSNNSYGGRVLQDGEDYERLNSARLLTPSEYTLNDQLGFISLKTALNTNDILSVAYEYTYNGKTYKVGELTTDNVTSVNSVKTDSTFLKSTVLFTKLVKGVSTDPLTNPKLWNLMMKNVYNIGGYNIQEDKFKLEVKYNYQNDSISSYLTYIPEGDLKNKPLLKVMNLDRLNSKRKPYSDGKFDFLEGYTILASQGRIIFPTVEPFGNYLAGKFSDPVLGEKYSFKELYRMLKNDAEAYTEKNKFLITGEYKSTSGSEIKLNVTNVSRGSVKVTAGGRTLEENVGYTVDYNLGVVRILDESVLASNQQVNVTVESESFFSSQRKSLFGANMEYAFNDRLSVGATIMHLSEKPFTDKVSNGNEPIRNTIWGINGSYSTTSNWLTKVTNYIPLISTNAPSNFSISAEVAQMIPGHGKGIEDKNGNSVSYIDDFEGTESSISVMSSNSWVLASVPERKNDNPAMPFVKPFIRNNDPFWNGVKENNIKYGLERAHFAWYQIDNILQKQSSSTPDGITSDDMSNHFTRQIQEKEIYQNKDPYYGETSTLPTFNIAFYPKERGMYNLDVTNLKDDGTLDNETDRWGGIMRKLETTNFDKSNIEYLEFWMMDPYAEVRNGRTVNSNIGQEGKLIINLGEISEDILHDGQMQGEHSLPTKSNGLIADTATSIWGRVPTKQNRTIAFDYDNIAEQDLGLDGLSSDEEKTFNAYARYINEMSKKPSSPYIDRILDDPAGDDFHHFRGSDYDAERTSILDRYKYYNGMEGNSTSKGDKYNNTSTTYPNTEDINGDNTLNEKENYYEYVINIDSSMFNEENWEKNFIVNASTYNVPLKNKKTENITWYQFRVPIKGGVAQGKINGFSSIRFMRLYLTGFKDEAHLRFATMQFTKTDWSVYNQKNELFKGSSEDCRTNTSAVEISSVNIEKDSNKKPVGYVLPPGIERSTDPSQSQVRMENEQSMLLKINKLGSKEACAVYKRISLDTRQYERFRMFVHCESLIDETPVPDNRLFVFVRMGSDFTENYYEYMIPLKVTPRGATLDTEVWPSENVFDFKFQQLTDLKLRRNKKKMNGEVSYMNRYTEMDGDNLMTVMGNPTFGDIRAMMIGIKNEDQYNTYNTEVWLDEMRMTGFNEDGGWAALVQAGFTLADFASFDATGRIETTGFGSIESNVMDRNMEDTYSLDISTTMQLGKFFPEKAKVNMPLSITYSKEKEKPKYDPLDTDVELKDALDTYPKSVRDSIEKMSVKESKFTSYALTNVRVGIVSKKPMPYDPANFSFSVAYSKREEKDPEVEYDVTRNYSGELNYNYSLNPKIVEPFKKLKFLKSNHLKLFREFNFYYLPSSLSFSTSMKRYYNEIQTRDYTNSIVRDSSFSYLSWDKDWTWDRTANIKWNLSKALKFTFTTKMNSTIDEVIATNNDDDELHYKDIPVNKDYLFDIDQGGWYKRWKDTVWASIKDFGSPYTYDQRLNVNYTVPINKLPYLDWITSNAQYSADYQWQKGAEDKNGVLTAGNIAFSKRTWNGDVRFNLESLYNKSSYLKGVNKMFSNKANANSAKKDVKKKDKKKDDDDNNDEVKEEKKEPEKPKTYERKNMRLKAGNKTRISHRLNSNRLKVTATDKDGNPVNIKFEVIDANAINIIPKADVNGVNLVIESKAKPRTKANDIIDGTTRVLMLLRNVSATYRQTNDLTLSGYKPGSGFMGQNNKAPGYDFTFGFFNENKFLQKCFDKEWMAVGNGVVNPINKTVNKDFQVKALLEPWPGVKIDVNGAWSQSRSEDLYYMYDGKPSNFDGMCSKTDIAIKTAFKGGSVQSDVFEQFLANKRTMQARVSSNFTKQTGIDDPNIKADKLPSNSADVLVPAFVSAYTGRDANKQKFNLLPALKTLLPNWKLTMDLASKIASMKKVFKTFNITHGYRCTYNVNNYESYNGWEQVGNSDYGLVPGTDGTAETGYYAGRITVGNVNFNEQFNPLFGVNCTMNNSLRLKAEFKKTRTASLDVSALQVVETYSNELVVGSGYRIDDFGGMLGWGGKQKKVSNDLNLNFDISYKMTDAYIRKIEEESSERSSGLNSLLIQFSAEYVLSKMVKIKFYFDRTASTPKVSTSYPTVNTECGFSVKFQLSEQ